MVSMLWISIVHCFLYVVLSYCRFDAKQSGSYESGSRSPEVGSEIRTRDDKNEDYIAHRSYIYSLLAGRLNFSFSNTRAWALTKI